VDGGEEGGKRNRGAAPRVASSPVPSTLLTPNGLLDRATATAENNCVQAVALRLYTPEHPRPNCDGNCFPSPLLGSLPRPALVAIAGRKTGEGGQMKRQRAESGRGRRT